MTFKRNENLSEIIHYLTVTTVTHGSYRISFKSTQWSEKVSRLFFFTITHNVAYNFFLSNLAYNITDECLRTRFKVSTSPDLCMHTILQVSKKVSSLISGWQTATRQWIWDIKENINKCQQMSSNRLMFLYNILVRKLLSSRLDVCSGSL